MKITVQDLATGKILHLRKAELPQSCPVCGMQMQYQVIVREEGNANNWCCFRHLSDMLEETKTDGKTEE